jgi:SnoaL-like domain
MSKPQSPVDIAVAFTKAWTSRDFDTASRFLADDVVFDGPMAQTTGAAIYLEGLSGLARSVTGVRILAAFGDEQQALLMYDLLTEPFGTLTCAKHLTIRDGKIQRDKLTFDSHLIRKAQAPAQR